MRNAKCGYIVVTRTGGVKHGPAAPDLLQLMENVEEKKRQPTSDALMSRAARDTCSATIA
jgi:hypothetical protein